MADQDLVLLCQASDVTEDTPVKSSIAGEDVAVFQVGEDYYITANLCTHGPGELSDGFVEGDEIECPFHQGKFSILTGLPTAPPCTVPLKTWTAELKDGAIYASPTPRSGA
jgi:nitrite reductase/ring-hydroxylating ferredoxin subunit